MSLKVKEQELEPTGIDSGGSPIYNYKGQPFTGIRLTHSKSGVIAREEEYQNGYLEGWVRSYHKNGKLKQEYKLHNNETVDDTFKEYDEQGNLTESF